MRGRMERPAGLVLALEAIDRETEEALIGGIRTMRLAPVVIDDTPSRRHLAHFGVRYDETTFALGQAPKPPPALTGAVRQVARALGVAAVEFPEVLVTDYPARSGIGRHRDAPAFDIVIGLSLMNPCTMQFELGSGPERRVWEQVLPQRSAYLLSGAARWRWRHGIDAVPRERMSLTARSMRVLARPMTVAPRVERRAAGF